MKDVLEKFDQFLSQNNEKLQAVVIGGAALIIMNVITRKTKDVDLLDPIIPKNIKNLSVEFSKMYPELNLYDNWLNNGPISLKKDLPDGWQLRLVRVFNGKAITLDTLGRLDLLKTKLFACCDRQQDYDDCLKLKPTKEEIDKCFEWVSNRDANPAWPNHVKTTFEDIINEIEKS